MGVPKMRLNSAGCVTDQVRNAIVAAMSWCATTVPGSDRCWSGTSLLASLVTSASAASIWSQSSL